MKNRKCIKLFGVTSLSLSKSKLDYHGLPSILNPEQASPSIVRCEPQRELQSNINLEIHMKMWYLVQTSPCDIYYHMNLQDIYMDIYMKMGENFDLETWGLGFEILGATTITMTEASIVQKSARKSNQETWDQRESERDNKTCEDNAS